MQKHCTTPSTTPSTTAPLSCPITCASSGMPTPKPFPMNTTLVALPHQTGATPLRIDKVISGTMSNSDANIYPPLKIYPTPLIRMRTSAWPVVRQRFDHHRASQTVHHGSNDQPACKSAAPMISRVLARCELARSKQSSTSSTYPSAAADQARLRKRSADANSVITSA